MRYQILATEVNALKKAYGDKIAARAKADTSHAMLKHEIEAQPGNDHTEKLIHYIVKGSPHPKYNRWLAQRYSDGGINKLDDLDKAHTALKTFHKHSAKIENKDIGSYKNLAHLMNTVEPHEQAKTNSEKRDATEKELENERTIVHNDPEYKVVIPHTERASIHYGKNTKWCTAAEKSRNYFNEYHPKGNLFYFLHKPTGKKHAIFVPHKAMKDGEFQAPEGFDEEDNSMSPRKIIEKHDPTADRVTHHVKSILHRVNMNLPKPDPEFAPKKE